MPIERIAILGTGLIGSSVGMALRQNGFSGTIFGLERASSQAEMALSRGAISIVAEEPLTATEQSDLILLSGPVFSILEWLDQLAPILKPHQLVTDVGSVKHVLCERAASNYNLPGKPGYLPGPPLARRETGW